MRFEENKPTFQGADRRFAKLKRQHDVGAISDEEFDEQLRQLMVTDAEGKWWAKSRKTGEWHYHDGTAWVKGTPPGYQPNHTTTTASSDESTTEAEQRARPTDHSILADGRPKKGSTQVTRVQEALNKPRVVLVAGVVAMTLNVLLYFGYYLPRSMLLIERIHSSSTSLPVAPLKSPSGAPPESPPAQKQSPPVQKQQSPPQESTSQSPSDAPPESPPAQKQSPPVQKQQSPPQESTPQSPSDTPPESPSPPSSEPPPAQKQQYQ